MHNMMEELIHLIRKEAHPLSLPLGDLDTSCGDIHETPDLADTLNLVLILQGRGGGREGVREGGREGGREGISQEGSREHRRNGSQHKLNL